MTPNPNPSPELKGCPVCGDLPKWRGTASDYRRGIFRLQCLNEAHLFQAYGPSEEACVANWNTRALSPQTLPAPELLQRARQIVADAKYDDPMFHALVMDGSMDFEMVDFVLAGMAEPQTLPAPGEVERMAIDQNDAMRQELAHVGNLVSDLERAMHADPARADGTWPDLGGRIRHLTNVALATVAAANDEGVAEQAAQFADGVAEGAQSLYALAARDRDTVGTLIHGEAVRVAKHIAAAIRLLSQGEGK